MQNRSSGLPSPLVTLLASIPLAGIFVLVGVLFWLHDRRELEENLAEESAALRTTFEVALSDLEQQMLALASMTASDPAVQALLHEGKLSLEAEGGGRGGARTETLRQALYDHLAPAWSDMQRQFGVRQLHFQFGPGSLSYLRVHTPERYGDRMDGLRHIIVDVDRTREPRTGFETGRIYSGVRGVVPVWHTDRDGIRSYLGALEAGTSFDTQLARLDGQVGAGFAVLLKQQHVEGSVWEEYRPLSGPRAETGCRCYLEASSRDEVKGWMEKAVLPEVHDDGTLSRLLAWQGKDWHLTRFPLRDYLGKVDPARPTVGSVLVWRDKTAFLAAWKREQVSTQLFVVLAYGLAQALLVWVLGATRRGLQRRIDVATAALSESEAMLERAQSVARLGSWEMDVRSGRLAWSAETYRIFGLSPDVPADYALFQSYVHPDDRARLDAAWREALLGADYDVEHRIVVDGRVRWVREKAQLKLNEERELVSVVGTVQEITDLKTAEETLREVSGYNQLLLAAAGEGIYGVDPEGRTTFINPAALAMLGYSKDEVVGRLQHELFHHHHPDGRCYPDKECPIRSTLTDGQPRRTDEWFIRKDGSFFPVMLTVTPITENGERTGAVAVFQDVSARHAAEEDLRRARARLANVIERFHGGIVLEDETRKIVLTNQTFCDLFSVAATPEALIGADGAAEVAAVKASFVHPQRFAARMDEILERRQAVLAEELDMADGRTLERDYLPVLDDNGFLGHLWLYRDVTERKEKELELRRLATTDVLTGLPNRRYFLERLEQELARHHRFGRSASLLMIDIDHFKQVNDHYGHAVGDEALRHFARIARKKLRTIDVLGRLGGEEFAALLPNTDPEGARILAERLRQTVAAQPCLVGTTTVPFTVSIGVASFRDDDSKGELVLARADAALYRAKEQGRNKVQLA